MKINNLSLARIPMIADMNEDKIVETNLEHNECDKLVVGPKLEKDNRLTILIKSNDEGHVAKFNKDGENHMDRINKAAKKNDIKNNIRESAIDERDIPNLEAKKSNNRDKAPNGRAKNIRIKIRSIEGIHDENVEYKYYHEYESSDEIFHYNKYSTICRISSRDRRR
ncbi:hypothetical protein C2G38_2216778 [Gigaspora rosea]|uniref:Uncharacterized protein n=1 Tax=Gigaspora rosea TaxID=44941 RepID=A0A397U8R3_9GLOM|nr:hypothetical protein C2G38_2216778 [Gigaspora rosea]